MTTKMKKALWGEAQRGERLDFIWSILSIEKNHIKERDINLCKAWLLYVGWPSMWDTNWDLCRICRTSFILKQIKSMYVHISPYWWSVVWIDFHKKHNYHIFLWPFPGILYFLSPQNDLSCLNGQLSRKHTFHSLRFSQMEKWLHLLTNNHRPNILEYFKYFRYLRFLQMGNWLHFPTNSHNQMLSSLFKRYQHRWKISPIENIILFEYI